MRYSLVKISKKDVGDQFIFSTSDSKKVFIGNETLDLILNSIEGKTMPLEDLITVSQKAIADTYDCFSQEEVHNDVCSLLKYLIDNELLIEDANEL